MKSCALSWCLEYYTFMWRKLQTDVRVTSTIA